MPTECVDNVKILPRDGTVPQLFDGAFNLIRVAGDPRTNEFLLYQPSSRMLACTDLFHGSYTDYDPMNTWLVRVWFKFQRGGLFKDAGIMPAFRFNHLKNMPGGGIKRVQRFVDDLTRGLEIRSLVFAHGSGPLLAATDVHERQQRERGAVTGALAAAAGQAAPHTHTQHQRDQERELQQQSETFVVNALRAQYGLASIEQAVASGLPHPVTLADLVADDASQEQHAEPTVSASRQRQERPNDTPPM